MKKECSSFFKIRRQIKQKSILLCLIVVISVTFLMVLDFHKFMIQQKAPEVIVLEGKTMGTFWRVSIVNTNRLHIAELYEKIQSQLDVDDQLISTYKDDSELMLFNRACSTSPWPINKSIADIINESLHVGNKTYGAMDITVGSLINLWGFGKKKKMVNMPSYEEIKDAMKKTGLHHLTVINRCGRQFLQKDIPNLFVDLSTVGEGYAADHLSSLMMKEGIMHHLVSVGGALVGRGMKSVGDPWKVAIQKPTDQQNVVQAIVDINGYGISTSGSYRNYYVLNGRNISHIIDPKTGYPIDHDLVSVTVIAPTALEADAWDTGLMVLGLEKAKEVIKKQKLAAYLIIKQSNGFKTWMSPCFKGFLIREEI